MANKGQFGGTILLAEDDPELRELLASRLEEEGFQVVSVSDGQEALRSLGAQLPSAVVLELMLPRLSGTAVLEWLRRISSIPAIMITGSLEDSHFTNAFALGADDFLRKPFSANELVVRLRARLQSSQRSSPRTQLGGLLIDWARAEVFRGAQSVSLTPREFELLRALYQHREQVLTRDWLLQHVWGHAHSEDDRLIDSTVKRLRHKIGPGIVETVRGLGFRLMLT